MPESWDVILAGPFFLSLLLDHSLPPSAFPPPSSSSSSSSPSDRTLSAVHRFNQLVSRLLALSPSLVLQWPSPTHLAAAWAMASPSHSPALPAMSVADWAMESASADGLASVSARSLYAPPPPSASSPPSRHDCSCPMSLRRLSPNQALFRDVRLLGGTHASIHQPLNGLAEVRQVGQRGIAMPKGISAGSLVKLGMLPSARGRFVMKQLTALPAGGDANKGNEDIRVHGGELSLEPLLARRGDGGANNEGGGGGSGGKVGCRDAGGGEARWGAAACEVEWRRERAVAMHLKEAMEVEGGVCSVVEYSRGTGCCSGSVGREVAKAFPRSTVVSVEQSHHLWGEHLRANRAGNVTNSYACRSHPSEVLSKLYESPEFIRFAQTPSTLDYRHSSAEYSVQFIRFTHTLDSKRWALNPICKPKTINPRPQNSLTTAPSSGPYSTISSLDFDPQSPAPDP